MKDFSNPNAEAYRQQQETKKKQRVGAVFATILEAGSMAPAIGAETEKEQVVVTSPSGHEQRSERQSSGEGAVVLQRGMSKTQIEQTAKQAVSDYEKSQDVDWRHGKTDEQINEEVERVLHGGGAPKAEENERSDNDVDWRGGKTDEQLKEEADRVLRDDGAPKQDYHDVIRQEEGRKAAQAEREANIASEQEKQIDYIWGVKDRQRPDLLASGVLDETTRFEIRIVEDSFHLFVEGNEVPILSVDMYRDGGSHLFHTKQGNIFIPTYIVRGKSEYRPSFGNHSVRLETNNN